MMIGLLRSSKKRCGSYIRARNIFYPMSTRIDAESLKKMSLQNWANEFKGATIDLALMDVNQISYQESSSRMRALVKSGLLRHTDLRDNPERFFLAHRLLAEHATILGPGFWIRFTVHYNLCMGSILGLGTEEQVKLLDQFQDQALLGCFSLTEKFAGVNSGLIVNTTAHWDSKKSSFILNSPKDGANKNWISQGLVADKTVVVADLIVENKSVGPHGFLMDLRQSGELVSGVTVGDMGRKTVGNDLDNAWIHFDKVELPKSALLNRFGDIVDDKYVQKVKGMPVFHMIGQRLFTGRVAVAQAALAFRRKLFKTTKAYTDKKKVWSPSGEDLALSSIPQLKALYEEELLRGQRMESFLTKCETALCAALKSDTLPSVELVQAIAAAKVLAVEESISLCHRLRNEVGSYALMAKNGFEQTDFLQACKFAEGDSRVLMMKMSRDRLKIFEKNKQKTGASSHGETSAHVGDAKEEKACSDLTKKIAEQLSAHGGDKQKATDACWEEMYELSHLIMRNTVTKFMGN